MPLPPDVRAAVLRYVARTPGLVLVRWVTDRAGREAIAVAVDDMSGLPTRHTLLFDPADGRLLGREEMLTTSAGKLNVPIPSVIGYTVYLDSRYTDTTLLSSRPGCRPPACARPAAGSSLRRATLPRWRAASLSWFWTVTTSRRRAGSGARCWASWSLTRTTTRTRSRSGWWTPPPGPPARRWCSSARSARQDRKILDGRRRQRHRSRPGPGVERLLALGARPGDVGQTGDESWHVLLDPEGNEFCLLARRVDPA